MSAGFAVLHDLVKLVVVRVRIKTGVFNRLGTAHERMLQLCLKSLLHVICCRYVLRTALRKKKIISTGYKSTRYLSYEEVQNCVSDVSVLVVVEFYVFQF